MDQLKKKANKIAPDQVGIFHIPSGYKNGTYRK